MVHHREPGLRRLPPGRILKEIYAAKLAWQFPGRAFCVSLYTPEDPEDLRAYEITFWQGACDAI